MSTTRDEATAWVGMRVRAKYGLRGGEVGVLRAVTPSGMLILADGYGMETLVPVEDVRSPGASAVQLLGLPQQREPDLQRALRGV